MQMPLRRQFRMSASTVPLALAPGPLQIDNRGRGMLVPRIIKRPLSQRQSQRTVKPQRSAKIQVSLTLNSMHTLELVRRVFALLSLLILVVLTYDSPPQPPTDVDNTRNVAAHPISPLKAPDISAWKEARTAKREGVSPLPHHTGDFH